MTNTLGHKNFYNKFRLTSNILTKKYLFLP